MDLNKIPRFSREILENFMIPLNPDNTVGCHLNNLNAIMSFIITSKRIKLRVSQVHAPQIINYNALNFVPSGWGKDKPINELMKYVFTGFKTLFDEKKEKYMDVEKAKLKTEAEELYQGNLKKRNVYIKTEYNKISRPKMEMSDATAPALYRDCLTLQNFGFGSIYLRIKELALFIDAQSTDKKELFQMILELYDGNLTGKSLKSEANIDDIYNMPLNCIFYSSASKLLEGKANYYFDSLMETGLCRRCFTTYQSELNLAPYDIHNQRSIQERAILYGQSKAKEFDNILENVPFEGIYTLTSEADIVYQTYIYNNREKATKLYGKTHSVIISDLLGRQWRMIVLAALIAAIEHPQYLIITPQDVEYAIYETELFAKDFEKFFKATPTTDVDKLFYYLFENQDKWITKMDLRRQKFTQGKNFKSWVEESFELVEEIANQKGFTIIQEPHGKGGIRYKLTINHIGEDLSNGVKDIDELL